ncbi:MAG: 16S rRNA (guanine(527)-N(7))-methyltransferase RsmG, partial [Oscillospiraceae bacterium]
RVLCEYCIPLVKQGGYFIPMKGELGTELGNSKHAIAKLGAKYIETIKFSLIDEDKRSLVVCQKISATPQAYPRNGGKISKSPIT